MCVCVCVCVGGGGWGGGSLVILSECLSAAFVFVSIYLVFSLFHSIIIYIYIVYYLNEGWVGVSK